MRREAAAAAGDGASPPPLFAQSNVRKPEYWQFARLIAPSARLPEGKKAWTTDDATGIWCLRCAKALAYQKGSSQSIRYHMETKHFDELMACRERLQIERAAAKTPSPARGTKRKLESDVESEATPYTVLKAESPATTPAFSSYTTSSLPLSTIPKADTAQPAISTGDSWSKNVERRGGFWGNAYWYDLQLTRRMPLADRMLSELVMALPPCDDKRVLDICAGSGRASCALLQAYPTAAVVLLDSSSERLGMASKRIKSLGFPARFQAIARSIDASDDRTPLLEEPVDVVIGSLAFHVLIERAKHYAGDSSLDAAGTREQLPVRKQYERIFRAAWLSLKPGGHLIFGDHVGQLPLFEQLLALASVGFEDVDCAWRQDDSFVAGARKPTTAQ